MPSACHAGFYKRCCSKKASFERWLDRSLVWAGKAPKGFNNQFRIFDKKLKLIQKASLAPHARGPRSVVTVGPCRPSTTCDLRRWQIKRFVVVAVLFALGGFLK